MRFTVLMIAVLMGTIGLLLPSLSLLANQESPRLTTGLPRVLIIGDSISIGYTPHVVKSLAEKALVKHNRGNAQHTGTGLQKLEAWLGEEKWDVIHFNWGLWDLCYRNAEAKTQGRRDKVRGTLTTSLEQYEENLHELVNRLQKTGAQLVWAHTTVVPKGEVGRFAGDAAKYNQVAARIMKKHSVVINDLHSLTKGFAPALFVAPGNVHFTTEGYKQIAAQVAEKIEEALDLRAKPAGSTARTYTNPVIDEIGPADPCVILYQGKYYLYPTGDNRSYHVYYSQDLTHWTKGRRVFEPGESNVWAPDVFHDPASKRFYLYYTVQKRIGVAVADQPDGTFEDRGTLFENAIDAHLFRDDDGKLYLYYVLFPGFRIHVQRMKTPLDKDGDPIYVLSPTEPWETTKGAVTEGPWMLKHAGTYYLLYSGTAASSLDYAIGYATAPSPLGPFKKYPGNPIVKRGGGALGPGHGCVVRDGADNLWSVYHQQKDGSRPWNRFVCLDPFWFDAKGILHGKATRGTPQPAPVPLTERLSEEKISPAPGLFDKSNLVAWCIVPFDARRRGPRERALMLKRLAITKLAYDWRAKHISTFEEEILALKAQGIEFFAFWGQQESMFLLFEKYKLSPQVWQTLSSPNAETQEQRVEAAARQLLPLVKRTRHLKCKLGLYNHGGWGGEPQNLVAVCQWLRTKAGADHVGIVYNFHHGHDHIQDFAESLKIMKPYLLCLNLNGMNDGANPKILPIGRGQHDRNLLRDVLASGYRGPIGILDHRGDTDSEETLRENLKGLQRLKEKLQGD